MTTLRSFPTTAAPPDLLAAARDLMDAAFGPDFTDDDWDHALGGTHVVLTVGPQVVAHAALVPRRLEVDGRALDAGYVEAVATAPAVQGKGYGSMVMEELGMALRSDHDLGALSTERHSFYERLGWERWQGTTFVRRGDALVRTADEDAGIMVHRFGPSRDLPLTGTLVCEARQGDDW